MPTIRPKGNRAGGAYASQVGGHQPARGNYPTDEAPERRTVTVYADVLERVIAEPNAQGFLSNALGVRYVDDGTGVARKLVGLESTDDHGEWPRA